MLSQLSRGSLDAGESPQFQLRSLENQIPFVLLLGFREHRIVVMLVFIKEAFGKPPTDIENSFPQP